MVWKITWGMWQTFTRALESHKIGTFVGFFCPKLKMYELKIYRLFERCKIGWGINLLLQNWHEDFCWILTRALESLKSLLFSGLPLTKVYNVWVKEVQRNYVWWHWVLMQNLKENWLLLSKMTWGIWEIFTRALESL